MVLVNLIISHKTNFFAEVVISMLVERFELALPEDKKIVFRNSGILAPVLSTDKMGNSALPLKVRPYRSDRKDAVAE